MTDSTRWASPCARLALAVVVIVALPAAAGGAEKCKAKIRAKTGAVEVSAKGIEGAPRWGGQPGGEFAAFLDAGSCLSGGRLKKCHLGEAGTLAERTPPTDCSVCVADDGPGACCALVRGCTPGVRRADGSFPDEDPRVEPACPPDSTPVGSTCVDRFEASVWTLPPDNPDLAGLLRRGEATVEGLEEAGATQYGVVFDDYPCADQGNDCPGLIFAASVPGTLPSRSVSWFQALQACANSGKHLLTNAEWQAAAAGTPDPGTDGDGVTTCATFTADAVETGTTGDCISAWGVHDMVGNLDEWVAAWLQGDTDPWAPTATNGDHTGPDYGSDWARGVNPAGFHDLGQNFPAALRRGGGWISGTFAGVFSLDLALSPTEDFAGSPGFRCGRPVRR